MLLSETRTPVALLQDVEDIRTIERIQAMLIGVEAVGSSNGSNGGQNLVSNGWERPKFKDGAKMKIINLTRLHIFRRA